MQKLVDGQAELFTSHHVVEEVLFIVNKLAGAANLPAAVRTIAELPGLSLIEPDTDMAFAARYTALVEKAHLGVNDALLVQLMLDNNLHHLFTFDQPLLRRAATPRRSVGYLKTPIPFGFGISGMSHRSWR